MKKFKVTYSVTYKITDHSLYEELEENESSWVDFLTKILDSVRFSEDFTKRWVSTEGDELYWDDEAGFGEAEVLVTIEDDYEGNKEYWNELLPFIKETFGGGINTEASLFNLNDFATLIAEDGAFWHIVKWGTTINFDDEAEGCLFERDEDARDLYLDKLENLPKRTVIIDAQFIDGVGNHYELCDLVKTKEEVLNSVEKINND